MSLITKVGNSDSLWIEQTVSQFTSLCLSSSAPATELGALIEKLQKNADKVEKNIYEVEQNLNKVPCKNKASKRPQRSVLTLSKYTYH